MLDNLLNKQFKLALWNFILGFTPIVGLILLLMGATESWVSYGGSYGGGYYERNHILWYVGLSIMLAGGIAQFVIWIIGIVTAVKINSMTGDSTVLIIFAIMPMWFGLLIVAVIQRNKFRGTSSVAIPKRAVAHTRTGHPTPKAASHEDKLKASFLDGVITSAEYEKKLEDHRSKK